MDLVEKLKKREAKVGIIGGGYVGLPEAVEIAKKRFLTTIFDIKKERVDMINKSQNYIGDVKDDELKDVVQLGRLKATTDFSKIKEQDIICICVPTPLTESLEPDMQYIKNSGDEIKDFMKPGQLIILESTTYPGTTRDYLRPILEESGLYAGKDFYLVFSPERVDPGNKMTYQEITKIIGGLDSKSLECGKTFYDIITDNNTYSVETLEEAEMCKILENVYRSINIGLVNEMKMISDKMGINFLKVIEAAKTKPYGFQAFYPGPGLGGHCFRKDHLIWVKTLNGLDLLSVEKLYQTSAKKKEAIEALSYNLNRKRIEFNRVTILSKRKAKDIISIKTYYNHQIEVTSLHPILISENNKIKIKYAKDVQVKDKLTFIRQLPNLNESRDIDIIPLISSNKNLIKKVRVRCSESRISKIKLSLRRILKRKDQFYDFIKDKYLPLDLFLKFEKELKIPRKDIMLSTGKGNSYFIIPNIIKVNKNFCRLLGYYLSEGCQTTEKTTRRIRFTFHRDEKEYINDVKLILNKLKIKYSEWQDPRWKNHHIKISSELLGRVFDWLGCGKNCYEMKIPEQFFLSNPSFRLELLKGLFRGDGWVSVKKGKQTYTKKEKQYTNNINSIEISYFSSSRILLEQVQLILREQGIINSLEKRSGLIRIKTLEGFIKSKDWFLGEKKIKIEKYLKDKQKSSDYKYAEIKQDSILLLVSSVKKLSAKEYVYSLEIEPNKTLITNGGIIAHNCIPLDPFYLTYAARLAGKDTKFIELAGQINRNMPEYVVEQARDILNQYEMSLKGSNVLLIGITYKPNIDDSRESPALDILKILKEKGANVRFYDPYVTKIKDFEQKKAKVNNEEAKSIELKEKIIQMQDLVIITTNHAGIDYNLILKNAKAIYDTRNAFNDIKDKKIFRGYEIN